jgi:hypothetical protein
MTTGTSTLRMCVSPECEVNPVPQALYITKLVV